MARLILVLFTHATRLAHLLLQVLQREVVARHHQRAHAASSEQRRRAAKVHRHAKLAQLRRLLHHLMLAWCTGLLHLLLLVGM